MQHQLHLQFTTEKILFKQWMQMEWLEKSTRFFFEAKENGKKLKGFLFFSTSEI